jgi:RHS repeat-associated protein
MIPRFAFPQIRNARRSSRRFHTALVSRLAVARVLAILMASAFPVAVHAQCDYDSNLSCSQQPPCQGADCSLTPSVPPPGVTYGPSPGSSVPSGPQPSPDNPTIGNVKAKQRETEALDAADAVITNSPTQQPAPGLDNLIVITNSSNEQWIGSLVDDGRLPTLQARSTPRLLASLPHSEPVAGDGEFVVDETDLTLPGVGIPFVFSRHYRSGVDYQTPLGFGWNHTFNQRLVVASDAFTPPRASTVTLPDVFLINDRLEQLRFAFNGTSSDGNDVYVLQSAGTMTLKRQHGVTNAVWQLDDGSGLIHRFDGTYAELISIADAAGHTIRVAWQQGSGAVKPKVANVTDTTGRVIYFVYQPVDQMTFWPPTNFTWLYGKGGANPYAVDEAASIGPTGYEYLACLSLTQVCGDSNTLVSFNVTPITATSDPVRYVEFTDFYGAATYRTTTYTYEFDLTQVLDSKNHGPTYKYYREPDKTYLTPGLYLKEFDDYWPSQYAEQLYQAIQKQIPALEAMCPSVSQAAVDEADTHLAPDNSLCLTNDGACIAKEVDTLNKKCVKDTPAEVKALKSRISSVYRYGTPPQLYHNLIEIDDADGRKVVQNTYGIDTAFPDFDRVNKQVLGGDPNNTTTYSYVDGADTGAFALESPFTTFYPVDVCPRSGASYGPVVDQPQLHSDGFQTPTLEIISKGPLGRTNSVYVDANGEILRSSDTAGVATNHNYSPAGPSGILYPNGQRSCMQYDGAGRVSSVSQIPSPGSPGDTIETSLNYDNSEELVGETQTVNTEIISDRSILRDAVERVIGIGDAVDTQHSRWTCYQYADTALGPVGPVVQRRAIAQAPGPQGTPNGLPSSDVPVDVPFKLSPCALLPPLPSATSSVATRAVIPSRVTRPDGTVTEFGNITPTGPGEMVADATGTAPLDRYFVYDTYGRLSETGLRDFVTKQILPASIERWTIDLEGFVRNSYIPDSTNPSQFLNTTYSYDKSGNLTGIDDPLLDRVFTTDMFGKVLSVTETPTGRAGASGSVRASCATYNAYEQPAEIISPEGNVTAFTYDSVGQLTAVSMGPRLISPLPSTGSSGTPCVAATSGLLLRGGASPRETVAQFTYNADEQISAISSAGLTLQYAYDGLGRLIDTFVPDHLEQSPPGALELPTAARIIGFHHAIGYQGLNKAWEAITDRDPVGVLPAYLAPGVHAATEYSYDLIGRPLQIKRWQFTESPIVSAEAAPYGTTTLVYDDAHNSTTITDPFNSVYFARLDGVDRPVETVSAQGAPEEIDTTYSYSGGGLVVGSVTTPAPTATRSLTRTQTYSPGGTLLQFQEQGRTLLQRQLDSFGRVQTEQTPSDVAITYGYDAFNQVLTLQEQSAPNSVFVAGTFSWNRDGSLLTTLDGAQHSTLRSYDVLGRLQTLTNGLGATTYSYVPGTSLPASIASPAAIITTTYDLAGRPAAVSVVDAAGRDTAGSRSFQYSPLGEITVATLAGSGLTPETLDFAYDSLGRRTSESDNLSPFTLSRVYGQRTEHIQLTASAASVSIDRATDALSRPLLLQVNGQSIAQWQYANGGPSSLNYVGGTVLSYGYNSIGQIVSTSVMNGNLSLASVSRSFGSDNLPHQSTLNVNAVPVETNYFEADTAGRVIAEQTVTPGLATPPPTLENSDVASLLTAAGAQYTLDGAANWQARSGPQPLNTVIDSANRYSAINGQTVQNVSGGGIQSFQNQQYRWNGLNELTSASIGSNSRQWRRDALGRPTLSTDAQGNATRLIWDGETLIGTMPNGQTQTPTIHVGFTSQESVALVTPNSGASLLYHGPDESVFAVSDDKGELDQAYSYTAFGVPHIWNASGSAANGSAALVPYLFQGAYYDSDVSLSEMGARMYAPGFGRFLSPDPIGQSGGLNLFSFVDGRPLTYDDPTGTSGRPAQNNGCSQGNDSCLLQGLNLRGDLFKTNATGGQRSPMQELPPIEDSFAWLHVGDSFIANSYNEAKQSFYNDKSLTVPQRLTTWALGTLLAPLALGDQLANGILNLPYSVLSGANQVGQRFAQAYVTRDYDDKWDLYGDAILGTTGYLENGMMAGQTAVGIAGVTRRVLADNIWFRSARNEMVANAPLCEYCGQEPATQMDHFLPVKTARQLVDSGALMKDEAIEVLSNSDNLVPSCSTCNLEKSYLIPSLTPGPGRWLIPSTASDRVLDLAIKFNF